MMGLLSSWDTGYKCSKQVLVMQKGFTYFRFAIMCNRQFLNLL